MVCATLNSYLTNTVSGCAPINGATAIIKIKCHFFAKNGYVTNGILRHDPLDPLATPRGLYRLLRMHPDAQIPH